MCAATGRSERGDVTSCATTLGRTLRVVRHTPWYGVSSISRRFNTLWHRIVNTLPKQNAEAGNAPSTTSGTEPAVPDPLEVSEMYLSAHEVALGGEECEALEIARSRKVGSGRFIWAVGSTWPFGRVKGTRGICNTSFAMTWPRILTVLTAYLAEICCRKRQPPFKAYNDRGTPPYRRIRRRTAYQVFKQA